MATTTINNQFPLDSISKVFDGDQFYIKLFKNLLTAVTSNNFADISRTPTEIMHLYFHTRSKIEKFIMDEVYENIYSSAAYDGLIVSLIDIYSVMYTVIYLRANINDISIQPDEIVDAFLDSFGFKAKHLFNYIQRREICKVVYWYLRRKGTPALIIKLLDMLGFTYFYLCEFQIVEAVPPDSNIISNGIFDKHIYKSKLLYEELPKDNNIGFFTDTEYPYSWVHDEDPLCILSDESLSKNTNITFPAQSPYYQVGVAVTHADLEKTISAFTYAMIKKTLLDMDMGEDVFTSTINNYNRKVSFISLVLGWTYLMGQYFGIRDNYLYEELTIKEAYDITGTKYDITGKKYDQGDISRKDILYKPNNVSRSTNAYDNKPPIIYDSKGNKYDKRISENNVIIEGSDIYRLKYPVFGWQKDITKSTPLDIMYDIDREIKRLNKRLLWQPNESELTLNKQTNNIVRERNTIKDRKEKTLQEIYNIFYGAPIFGTYEKAVKFFEKHDIHFKQYIDSIMLTHEERLDLAKSKRFEDINDNFQKILEIMDNILESIEYFIFDTTTFMIPVRNLILSYEKIIRILTELDKYYTPYHAKLLAPMVVWLIRDLPGDCIAIDDTKIESINRSMIRDVVWRASHYSMCDIAPPDPYVPINDFECNNPNMPHIPISPNYLIEPYYNREELQKLNKLLYSIGYDWRKLDTNPFIVRNDCLKPIYDWDPDKLDYTCEVKLIDGFNTVKPEHKTIELLKNIEQETSEGICYINSYTTNIIGDGVTKKFFINHNIGNRDVIIQCYELSSGCDVTTSVRRITSNMIEMVFEVAPQLNNMIRVMILGRHIKQDTIFNHIGNKMFNIIGNGKLKNFIIQHNLNTDDIIAEVYDRITGEVVGANVRRINTTTAYISFNIAPNKNRTYRVNMFALFNKAAPEETPHNTFEHTATIIGDGITKKFEITHNFKSNNIITQVYSVGLNETVDVIVDHINRDKIYVDFKDPIPVNHKYKIVLIGSINKEVNTATPMNNLTGFTGTLKGNGIASSFTINHNLNSDEILIQVLDANSAEPVLVDIEYVNSNTTNIHFSVAPRKNKEFIISALAPLKIHRLTKPSSYYNTTMIQYRLIGNGKIKQYKIYHKLNSHPIFVQVYDKETGELVHTYTKLENSNRCLLEFKNALEVNKEYNVNVITLPNPSIKPRPYIELVNLNLVDMYNKTIIGDNKTKSFHINHNLDTRCIMVNVYDNENKETILFGATINNNNSISINLNNALKDTQSITVVIIGALPPTTLTDDFITVDNAYYRPPHHYREVKTYVSEKKSVHKSASHDHFDVELEYIRDPDFPNHIKYNTHKLDLPSIRERVDIIHEVMVGEVSTTATDLSGFNSRAILTNDKFWNREPNLDAYNQLHIHTYGLGEGQSEP